MCGSKPKAPKVTLPPPVVEEEPDVQISAKKKRDKSRGSTSSSSGLNRFLIAPNSGSGASVPE
jgi:hypothetical protein